MSVEVNITKRLGNFILRQNFTSEGGVMGLLGPSGCGKTITLQCIAGIMKPDEGYIKVNGRTIFDSEKKINLSPQERKIGYLFQDYALFPHMNVEQNIHCGIQNNKLIKDKKNAVADMIGKLHLEGLEKLKPEQLSGGQKQRVAMARILVGKPELLLLDEPMSALDSFVKQQIIEELKQVLKEFGYPAILVTHNMEEVWELCENTVLMEAGQVKNQGTRKQVQDSLGVTSVEHGLGDGGEVGLKAIIATLKKRCMEGQPSILVTIIESKGSSPRGAGSFMIVDETGRLSGTIGGGMLEYQAIKIAMTHMEQGVGAVKRYTLRQEESAELGMVCGGEVEVLFTYLEPSRVHLQILENIQESFQENQSGWLVLPLEGKSIAYYSEKYPEELEKEEHYIYHMAEESRVYIFGGGHLAQELVPVLTHLGFRCVVTDDREDFATRALFPKAEEVHVRQYTELKGKYQITPRDYIIAVTRGHLGDFHVQEFALQTQAYYIGVVGSKRKIKNAQAKLLEMGYEHKDLDRVTAPIGLDIKSETPAEIAISIAAQLVLVRANQRDV